MQPNIDKIIQCLRAAVIAEQRAERSQQCRAWRQAEKARGVDVSLGARMGREKMAANTARRDAALRPVLESIISRGVSHSEGIARELGNLGIPTANGGQWAGATVRGITRRLGIYVSRLSPVEISVVAAAARRRVVAERLRPAALMIKTLYEAGMTQHEIACELNRLGMTSANGRPWTAQILRQMKTRSKRRL